MMKKIIKIPKGIDEVILENNTLYVLISRLIKDEFNDWRIIRELTELKEVKND